MSFTAMVAIAMLVPSMCVSFRRCCRRFLFAAYLLQVFREAIETLAPAALVAIALASRLEAGLLESNLRFVALGSEVDCNEHLMIRLLIPDKRVNDSLFGDYLAINSVLPVFGPVRGNH